MNLSSPTLIEEVKSFLHDSPYITAVGMFLVFLTALINLGFTLFYAWRNTKRTNFINAVTASRIEWIQSLREKMSSFIATAIALNYAKEPGHSTVVGKDAEQMRVEMDTLRYSIFLHLNPDKQPDKEIQALVLSLYDASDKERIDHLAKITQRYIKNEWERVKDEAESGRLKS